MARSSLRYVLPLAGLLFMSSPSAAEQFPTLEERTFESWQVMRDKRGVNVGTRNAAGLVLGWSCTGDGCRWILVSPIDCEPGTRYNALASSGAGSYPLTLECLGNSATAGYSRYQLTPDGSMDALVKNAKHELGIVMSKVGGQFEVVRFSMQGYGTAINFWGGMFDRWLSDSGSSVPAKSTKPDRQLL